MQFTERELERFWDKVHKSDGCWNWTASKYPDGYGAINIRRKCRPAHQISWLIHYGEIPNGCEVCHHCDNPACVRPDHLYAASHSQNVKDMHIKGRGVYTSGDDHWTRKYPERVLRGNLNGAHKHPERMARGEKNGNSKLTEKLVRDMRLIYHRGRVSSRSLATRYGLDKSTVLDIVYRRIWKHVT